jgi:phosphopantothenoylcysteine decarboxylase / phosphopantothenate---cysteine ligase
VGAPDRAARLYLSGRRVLLGITGGIAAYKSITLARELTLAGAQVDVVLSAAALEFVRPLAFEAVTGRPARYDLYGPGDPLLHIRLAKEAEIVVVAPATANFLARAAAGMADDLLTAVLLATPAPVLVCPAMNDRMYAHPLTRSNIERLSGIGYGMLGPTEGPLAWGEGEGKGRMEEPSTILEHLSRLLCADPRLAGRHVVVTAGPTREAIDPVRFIGNRSSGRMGFAIAAEAWRLGADVTLLAGPTSIPAPSGVSRIDVETAVQMRDEVAALLPSTDVLVMAAAVADFRPASAADRKIKKESATIPTIRLDRTPDVLRSTVDLRPDHAVVVGFALETDEPIENGRRKLIEKDLDLLVVNDALEPGAGFEVPTNRVTILDRMGQVEDLPLLSKEEVAERILRRVADLLPARP